MFLFVALAGLLIAQPEGAASGPHWENGPSSDSLP